MQVRVNGKRVKCNNREKKVGNIPLATSIKTNNGKTKFIGAIANKPQLVITLPDSQHLNQELTELFHKYRKHAFIYVVSAEGVPKNKNIIDSTDFVKLSKRFGLFIGNQHCVKSVFIIDTSRKIAYSEILPTLNGTFNINVLDKALNKILSKKREPIEQSTEDYKEITSWYLEHG